MVKNVGARFFQKGAFPKCPVYARIFYVYDVSKKITVKAGI
jgi:hypothetical protein